MSNFRPNPRPPLITSTKARNYVDKFGDVISALDYCAGDGTTDDTEAMQAASNSARDASKALYIPGTPNGYRITDTVTQTCRQIYGDAPYMNSSEKGTRILWRPAEVTDLKPCFRLSSGLTAGSGMSRLTIDGPANYTIATLYSNEVVNPTDLPNYSAFATGVAAIEVAGSAQPVFHQVATRNCKVGLLMNSTSGHISTYECYWTGLFGVYCKRNSGDYLIVGGHMTGTWAGLVYGNFPHAGHNGGFDGDIFRVHSGFGPYCIYQVKDDSGSGTPSGLRGLVTAFRCERVGECVWQTLSNATVTDVYFDSCGLTWSEIYENHPTDPGSPWITNLPGDIIPYEEQQQYAYRLGTVSGTVRFKLGPGYSLAQGGNGVAAAKVEVLSTHFSSDLDVFAGDVAITSRRVGSWLTPQRGRTAGMNDLAQRRSNNLLKDALTLGNWTIHGDSHESAAIEITDWSTLAGGELSDVDPPQNFFTDLGRNPGVIKFSVDRGENFRFQIAPPSSVTLADNELIWFSCWAYLADGRIRARLQFDSPFPTLYDQVYGTANTAGWVNILCFDRVGPATSKTLQLAEFLRADSSPTTGLSTAYIAGLMVGTGQPGPYNRWTTSGLDGIAIDNVTTGTTAPSAGGGDALPATPAGYMTVKINGTDQQIPYY